MAAAAQQQQQHGRSVEEKELLSSVVSDIRFYSGSDPLRPWLRGIRRLEGALPPAALREKLPRFLQKCAQEFQDEPRYRDDPRYLRVWIQMMDYVKDARPLLKKLERNRIGLKRAAFYMAYALYYEKRKRFEDAEKMYRLGIHNLAEPIDELHNSHDQFIHRLELYKKRKDKLQEGMPSKVGSVATYVNQVEGESRNCTELKPNPMRKLGSSSNPSLCHYPSSGPAKVGVLSRGPSGDNKNLSRCNSDDTVVVRFVGSALVGKSETEDACHHGLVEPTINMKEAMDAINSMFLEPVEPDTMLKRRSKRNQPKFNQQASAFEIFVDEDQSNSNDTNILHDKNTKSDHPKISQQTSAFEIFVDEDGPNCNNQNVGQNRNSNKENMINQKTSGLEIFVDENEPKGSYQNAMGHKNTRCPPRPLHDSCTGDFEKPFVGGFAILPDGEDEQCEKNDDGVRITSRTVQPTRNKITLVHPEQADTETRYSEGSHPVISGLREDTIMHRFVGSAVVDEPKVENACHHGLVDPTVNLKEAMDDINSMFEKPLNFKDDKRRNKKTNAVSDRKPAPISGFSILADDENAAAKVKPSNAVSDRKPVPISGFSILADDENAAAKVEPSNAVSDRKPASVSGFSILADDEIHAAKVKPSNAVSDRKPAPISGFSILADDENAAAKVEPSNAVSDRKPASVSGFSILADDENHAAKVKLSNSCTFGSESDLFEPTITTRNVMAEINDMFGMSLDF